VICWDRGRPARNDPLPQSLMETTQANFWDRGRPARQRNAASISNRNHSNELLGNELWDVDTVEVW
jgi:hypothetical protein